MTEKVLLITGASSGIGAATAELFVNDQRRQTTDERPRCSNSDLRCRRTDAAGVARLDLALADACSTAASDVSACRSPQSYFGLEHHQYECSRDDEER